ncbi:MAG TPA: phosphoribosyltransferase family protein [Candidatus Saccharimonadales bacterium]|nr:phosphoribosyltransferase family protein [Candidatus Saccharimonadales bacterium]
MVNLVRAATIYDSFAKDLVWRLKFQGARAAARVMAKHMVPLIERDASVVIVPIPTATRRARQRGFDQAYLITRHLARTTGLCATACLRRDGQTHQVGASRKQRLSQLESAFALKRKTDLRGRRVILVDDVMTTGATIEAAAAVIRMAKPSSIEAVVFAQAD